MSLVRATATIGGLTLVSRILGFVRDMLFARFVGAGLAADCFLIAFRLPNLFRALFAEGAFSAAFVPMFSRTLGANDGQIASGQAFAEDVLAVLLPVLALFTAAMIVLAWPVVWVLTGGFPGASPEKFGLAVAFTKITFPYLLTISLVSLLGGILNSIGRFWINAAAPVLLNIALIAALLIFRGHGDRYSALMQSAAVSIAGILQLLWLLWACHRARIDLRLRLPRLSPQVRQLLRLIGPAAIGTGAFQINQLISTALAARFLGEGAVSYLYYADRLNQLPLGLVGIGVGTALLPTLARQLGAGNDAVALHTQNRAVEIVLLLTLPAAAALVASAAPIVATLLEHGRFTHTDTLRTAKVLAAFSVGLPAYVLIKVLTPGFHARQDTRTPVRIALVAMAVNLAGNLLLIAPLGYVGIALSTAVSAWLNAALLYATLRRRAQFGIDARLRRTAPRLLLATVAMSAALVAADRLVAPYMAASLLARATALALLIAGGAAVYVGIVAATRAVSLADIRAQLTRRPRGAST